MVQYPCGYLGHQNLGHQSIQKWPDMTSSLYVIYVSGHYWMFAVQITECVFSLKSLGLLPPPTHSIGLFPKKNRFFLDPFPYPSSLFSCWYILRQIQMCPYNNPVYLICFLKVLTKNFSPDQKNYHLTRPQPIQLVPKLFGVVRLLGALHVIYMFWKLWPLPRAFHLLNLFLGPNCFQPEAFLAYTSFEHSVLIWNLSGNLPFWKEMLKDDIFLVPNIFGFI